MFFALMNSQNYFPCVSKIFPVLQQNSLCFPCLEEVRNKFPVFPVLWPPCGGTPPPRMWADKLKTVPSPFIGCGR